MRDLLNLVTHIGKYLFSMGIMSGLQNHNGRTDDRMDKKKPLKLSKNTAENRKRIIQVEPIDPELRLEIIAEQQRIEKRKYMLLLFMLGLVVTTLVVMGWIWF